MAALQTWDAPMIYNYSQGTFYPPAVPSTWSTYMDPGLSALMPAAALLYRQAHVSPALNAYCLMLDRQKLYFEDHRADTMATVRTLVEQSRVTIGLPDTPELAWDAQTAVGPGVTALTDHDVDHIPPGQSYVASDTGELLRDWNQGYQTIDTDRTQAAHGWIGGVHLDLQHATFDVTTNKAAVAITSLDDRPIPESHQLLITAIARVVSSAGGQMPLLSEPVSGQLEVTASPDLCLIPLAGDGQYLPEVPTTYANGAHTITLPPPQGTHWFLLADFSAHGDFDGDGDVDGDDYDALENCASGPSVPVSQGCEPKDLDDDGDVDQADVGQFQQCYSGSDTLVDPGCIQ